MVFTFTRSATGAIAVVTRITGSVGLGFESRMDGTEAQTQCQRSDIGSETNFLHDISFSLE
jgi:hypothetical protein